MASATAATAATSGGGGRAEPGGELLPHDELFASPRLILDTTANERLKSDRGTLNCVNEMVKELVPLLEQFVTIYTPRPPLVESPSTAQSSSSLSGPLSSQHGVPPPRVRISCVGHSFGGILLRAFLAALKADHATLWSQLDFEVFMTVATPHLGVRGLNRILRKGGELIGKVYSATYRDLLLMSEDHGPLANELITETALDVLAQFRVRRLYANTNKDILVSFATASLLVEGAKEHHPPPKTRKVGAPTPGKHPNKYDILLPDASGGFGGVFPKTPPPPPPAGLGAPPHAATPPYVANDLLGPGRLPTDAHGDPSAGGHEGSD
jgi:hypothetical protein